MFSVFVVLENVCIISLLFNILFVIISVGFELVGMFNFFVMWLLGFVILFYLMVSVVVDFVMLEIYSYILLNDEVLVIVV